MCSTKYLQKIKIQKTKSNPPSHPHLFSSRGDSAHIERFNLHNEFWVRFLSCELPYQILYHIPASFPFLSSHMVWRLPNIKSFGGRGISHTNVSPLQLLGCCTIMFYWSRRCEFFFLGKPAKSKLPEVTDGFPGWSSVLHVPECLGFMWHRDLIWKRELSLLQNEVRTNPC